MQQIFESPYGAIEYLDVGTGTPVLYFHGTGAGNDAALMLEKPLLDSNCRLIISKSFRLLSNLPQ
jgi:hypothetical protein